MTDTPILQPKNDRDALRALLVPVLQTILLLAVIVAVTVMAVRNVIDAPAVTAIIGAIVGSVGVLAGVGMARNGRKEDT